MSGKPEEELSDEERSTLDTAKTVLTEMIGLMGLDAHGRDRPRRRYG